MKLITHKKVAFLTIVILILQVVLMLESIVYSENDASEQIMNQINPLDFEGQGQSIEKIQEFSFVAKTFTTTVNQPTILHFTSKIAANQVIVRIPPEGKIVEEQLDEGSDLVHSHGEYWNLHTSEEQTTFNLPVTFSTAGGYFLTVDNDADHFYLEVKESIQEMLEEPIWEISEEESNLAIEQEGYSAEKDSLVLQPVVAQEEYLLVSEEQQSIEDERILEKITDAENRSTAYVSNWNDFRTAWNNSSRTVIRVDQSVIYSTSWLTANLNSRSTNLVVQSSAGTFPSNILFEKNNDAENLKITGNATVTFSNVFVSHTNPSMFTIEQSGSGKVIATQNTTLSTVAAGVGAVRAQNLLIENGSIAAGVTLASGGTLEIFSNNSTRETGVKSWGNNTGIVTQGSSNIYIKGNDFFMWQSISGNRSSLTWNAVDLHLSGGNGSTINSAVTNPDDFSLRYPSTGLVNYRFIVLNARGGSEWVNPPLPSYNLSLEASPSEGGLPTSLATTINQGETTVISANQNVGFDFIRWEISSGIGSNISNTTSATTTFTMGTSDTSVRAIYQRKQGGEITVEYVDESMNQLAEKDVLNGLFDEVYETKPKEIDGYTLNEVPANASGRFKEEAQTVTYKYTKDNLSPVLPMDPLNPEEEVNPENQPELPENQGALSIDFASQFDFGSQHISVQDKNYYVKSQRLLNEDGTVNEQEKRPNYVQISDRRSENDRNGWQLSVTQNNQFSTENGKELSGARMRLTNQQLATAQGGIAPSLQQTEPLELVPGAKRVLLTAQGNEGTGTWIYRFGDANTAGNSVVLDVPKGANPEATSYSSTFTWELSAVPGN